MNESQAPGAGAFRRNAAACLLCIASFFLLLPAVAHPEDAVRARMQTADADRLARLLEQTAFRPSRRELQQRYLDPASAGLAGLSFAAGPNAGATLERAIREQRFAYRHAIELCLPVARSLVAEAERWQREVAVALGVNGTVDAVSSGFAVGEAETVVTRPAPVDIVFGAGRSGGTVRHDRIVLALEVQCRFARTAAEAATVLEAAVRHEAVHRHQLRLQRPTARNSLLRQAMIEGLAAWLTEQQLGATAPQALEREHYGRQHEAALWSAFRQDMEGRSLAHWMYGPGKPGQPADLGYWIGKQIVSAYLASQPDRRQALTTLLRLENPGELLRESRYGQGFTDHSEPAS